MSTLSNQVKVTYDAKTKRLSMVFPFFLNDAARNFPSRRFDPRTKSWKIPLVKGNIRHMENTRTHIQYVTTPEAEEAIRNFEKITALPVRVPFPRHVYDFKRSELKYDPMLHQNKMLDMAWNLKSVAWFAKMGTGKTYAAIHLACARFEAGLIDAVMIIAPSTLRLTWKKELAKYATVKYDYRIHETKASWLKEFYNEPNSRTILPILGVSVEGLGVSEQLYDSVCGFFPKRRVMIICDESSRIKNSKALRTQRSHMFTDVSEYRMILNGTPIALGIEDLWAQYEFLDPNIIGCGDYWSYRSRYLEMGGYEQKQIVGYKNMQELMDLILPYTIEVGKDVLDLPPKVMKPRYVIATPEQRRLFKLIMKGSTGDPDEPMIKVDNVLERTLRCRQVAGGWLPRFIPDGDDPTQGKVQMEPLKDNPKMADLLSMIEDNLTGSKFIIWSSFVPEIKMIAERLAEIYGPDSVRTYFGETKMEERSAIEDAYCNTKGMKFFIGNPTAAGLGLTLISGENDVMVYYSGTNAYIDRAQSEDRAHRIGQKNTVTVVDIIMENTVDVLIQASIAAKMSIEEYVFMKLKEGDQSVLTLLG